MAVLRRLKADGLRNLCGVDLELENGTTILEGPNGAGKTALIEAAYLLGRGRSFRGRRHGPLVDRERDGAAVEGWIESGGIIERLHWKSRGEMVGAGAPADGPGEGRSQRLAVRLISDATHSLVEGEPGMRRRFIDWNLFHVEPRFASIRGRLRRIAAQRAAWLKSGAWGHAIWDRPYAEALCDLARARQRFSHSLTAGFGELTKDVDWFSGLALHWRSGVASLGEVLDRLEQTRESDAARGFTGLGASRDDFAFIQDGRRWVGSRGETKVVGVLLQLAAQRVVEAAGNNSAVWLVDDLAAELADASQQRLFEILQARAIQILLTALPDRAPAADAPVFHVEQGRVTPAQAPNRRPLLSVI